MDRQGAINKLTKKGIEGCGQYFFPELIDNLLARHHDKGIGVDIVCKALKTAFSIELLLNNLAEVFRLSKAEIERDLIDFGLGDLIQQHRMKHVEGETSSYDAQITLCGNVEKLNPFPDLFQVQASPDLCTPFSINDGLGETTNMLFSTIPGTFAEDPFIKLYREDVLSYYDDFMVDIFPSIEKEISELFFGGYPRYMVTTGIGANEQFTHFAAWINNRDKNRRLTWLIINSPKNLSLLPDDATVDNTLFVEFSRSSLTEETVKTHEYTPRNAKRIVFSNGGPLLDIAKRDKNLVLSLPDQVSGRYGRNKTPILLAPMLIAGMDAGKYWKDIDLAVKAFDISDPSSLPFVIAKFILIQQKLLSKNFIYLGCNDDALGLLADQFIQFWNEGVNKLGNDLLISRFFGLPRDSHMNIEGVLGNCQTKMGLFLLRTNMRTQNMHPMVSTMIDPINNDHDGLHFGDEEVILAMANYKRFAELMPSLLIEVPGEATLTHAAVLGQLFADVTFVYSRLVGIDPGSNPEVKFVRDRSAQYLSSAAKKIREQNVPIEEAVRD